MDCGLGLRGGSECSEECVLCSDLPHIVAMDTVGLPPRGLPILLLVHIQFSICPYQLERLTDVDPL